MLRMKKSWCPAWFIGWMVVSFLKIESTRERLDYRGGETDNELNAYKMKVTNRKLDIYLKLRKNV